ncbi:hypothetical protein GCM10023336_62920 [Streptomyces similanensis]|uniref:Transposase IS701-like DDE domain-containing protein n=1 Tax=Streptomyces similanensis TaxID=1274988 RepID=A0ABP9LG53_9ACTN
MSTEQAAETWDRDLDHLFTTIGHRFGRVEPCRHVRDHVRALLVPVARKNSWQLAEPAGHATPDGLQHLLSRARRNPDGIRDDLQTYVAEHLGGPDAVLIIDDAGFLKKGTTSPLAATIVRRALASPLPVAWVTADAAYGQDNRFRRMLENSGVGYVLAVPKSRFSLVGPRIDRAFEQAPDQARDAVPAARARRDSANTTGQPSSCAQCPSTTTRTAC